MIVEKIHTGAHSRKIVYAVCSDHTETGEKPHEIIRLDDLDTATAVMRYMRGDVLSIADESKAKEAIKKASVPTVESKHTRKAEN